MARSWQEIDPEAASLFPAEEGPLLVDHLKVWHPNLIVGHNPAETHDLAHTMPADHVHR